MTTIDRRRFLLLAIPTSLLQSWPDRASRKPETMTLEELTLKSHVQSGINEVIAKMVGVHSKQIRHLYWLVGGQNYPPAKGEL